MLTLTHSILIGEQPRYRLKRLRSLQLNKDIHSLGDQATLTLTALHSNQSLELQQKLPTGAPIRISLGYENELTEEFSGFITHTENKKDQLIIHSLDHIYLYHRDVPAKTYSAQQGPHLLPQILQDLAQDVSLQEVEVAEALQNFTYETFQRPAGPAIQTLKKIKKDLSILFYVRKETLFAQPPHYTDALTTGQRNTYRLDKNVLNTQLVYRKAQDKNLRIRVKSKDPSDQPLQVIASGSAESPDFQVLEGDSKPASAPSGSPSSSTETIDLLRYHIQDVEQLKTIAQQELSRWTYDGYEGHIETWLQPYCSYGYHAHLQDDQQAERSDTFFVEKVETRFSDQGGTRKVYLGKRISSSVISTS